MSNVAMVLSELVDQLKDQALVKIAPLVRLPDVQRLGYLLDAIDESRVADPLFGWLQARRPRLVPLQLGEPAKGDADNRWLVQPNVKHFSVLGIAKRSFDVDKLELDL